jgi:hypothetical protein
MSARLRRLALLLPVGLLVLLVACSSSNNNNAKSNGNAASNSNGKATQVSSQGTVASGASVASGKKLTDCEYAKQFLNAFSALNLSSAGGSAGGAGVVATVVAKTNQAVTDVKGLNPPDDLKQFHTDFVQVLDSVLTKMQGAQKTLDAGDPSGALTALNGASSDFLDQIDKLEQKYPAEIKRLNACPTS